MRDYDDLIAEALEADVSGWGFDWLDGRATEERPPWGYARLVARRLAEVQSALDIDTGGGEVVGEAPLLPDRMAVTESWGPNLERARTLLEPRGVKVVDTGDEDTLPFADQTFELVTSRHPVRPNWAEIARVLAPGGHYFAQHVGPASAFELIEYFLGPLPAEREGRRPDHEAAAAKRAGLVVESLQTARCRMRFHDIGAVVWTLRKCVWWVPDFSVAKYDRQLRALDEQLRAGEPFVAHSTRHLIEASIPALQKDPVAGR
ncbi:class I SAM-dependent methyltransferase [Nocardioidaceae bacterium SCSIO 66511]|nr:class I SAM-dependent methyltransferase [Nocardioidaceae bacterium SCSIO 66511]